MSVFTQFTSGTAGSLPAFNQVFTSSGTFTAPISGWYGFYVVGAGGAGGGAGGYDAPGGAPVAQGGSAGGSAVKIAYVASGTSIVVTIGAGGNAPGNQFWGNAATGNAGGVTTVVGGNVSITCNGGPGGEASVATQGTVNLTAKTGGTATGGDYNWTGGGVVAVGNNANGGIITGGGAVGVFGTGQQGQQGNTGGAGTGSTSGFGYGYVAFGGSTSFTNTSFNANTLVAPGIIFGVPQNGKPITNATNEVAGIGAGGGSSQFNSGSPNNVSGGAGGLFGGGGGATGFAYFPSNGAGSGGTGGRGAGGGGGCARSDGGFNNPGIAFASGGTGGSGWAMIGFLGQ